MRHFSIAQWIRLTAVSGSLQAGNGVSHSRHAIASRHRALGSLPIRNNNNKKVNLHLPKKASSFVPHTSPADQV